MTNKKREASDEVLSVSPGRFGTFGGVFTPCVLTILGVIMFMRVGYVTGHSGLWLALVILAFSKLITITTSLSISAIATNLDMRVGGVYFMISRVLGPDFGGSIGITLFFANAVGVAFYTIGFTEALFALLGVNHPLIGCLISSVMVIGLFVLTFKGADVAIKAQYAVLVILLLSVVSFIVGGVLAFDSQVFNSNLTRDPGEGVSFWIAFAIFFPAATGITAGANMSGDLKHPSKSIPRGTLLAILFTMIVYGVQMVLMAGFSDGSGAPDLRGDGYQVLQNMSVFFPLIIAGVFAATLSSALGSFLGAPRILQAMGQDQLMKVMTFFGKGSGDSNEPRRATVLTLIIALLVIWMPLLSSSGGNPLNSVAEVISMFFLIAYGMINLSAFVESKSSNPSFRPSFKAFHWVTALIGAIGCGVAMIKINETYALISLAIVGIIYFYLKKRDIKTSYGDAKRGFIFQRTRDNLMYLEHSKVHPKNWRPILVSITEDPKRDAQLVRLGSWLENRRGLYTVAHMVELPENDLPAKITFRDSAREKLKQQLTAENIEAFSEVVVVDDFLKELPTFLQSYSIGGLRPNTIAIKIPSEYRGEARERFLQIVDILSNFNKNLAILKPGDMTPNKRGRTIDLWWRGDKNGSLMALFAYLITFDRAFSGARLRIMRIVKTDEEEREAKQELMQLKKLTRISAHIQTIRSDKSPPQIIANTSGSVADLVLVGMSSANGEAARAFFSAVEPIMDQLPTTVFILSNGEADVFA